MSEEEKHNPDNYIYSNNTLGGGKRMTYEQEEAYKKATYELYRSFALEVGSFLNHMPYSVLYNHLSKDDEEWLKNAAGISFGGKVCCDIEWPHPIKDRMKRLYEAMSYAGAILCEAGNLNGSINVIEDLEAKSMDEVIERIKKLKEHNNV